MKKLKFLALIGISAVFAMSARAQLGVTTVTNLIPMSITNTVTGVVVPYTNTEIITVDLRPFGATVAGDTNAPAVETGLNFFFDTLSGHSTNWYGVAGLLYAKGLTHKLGGTVGVFTEIASQFTVFGVRIDSVDGGFWMPEGSFTLQDKISIGEYLHYAWASNIVVTPFAYAGVGLPLSGAKVVTTVGNINIPGTIRDNNGQATAITGVGGAINFWHRKTPSTAWYEPESLGVIADVENWSGFKGQQYRLGIEGHFGW